MVFTVVFERDLQRRVGEVDPRHEPPPVEDAVLQDGFREAGGDEGVAKPGFSGRFDLRSGEFDGSTELGDARTFRPGGRDCTELVQRGQRTAVAPSGVVVCARDACTRVSRGVIWAASCAQATQGDSSRTPSNSRSLNRCSASLMPVTATPVGTCRGLRTATNVCLRDSMASGSGIPQTRQAETLASATSRGEALAKARSASRGDVISRVVLMPRCGPVVVDALT